MWRTLRTMMASVRRQMSIYLYGYDKMNMDNLTTRVCNILGTAKISTPIVMPIAEAEWCFPGTIVYSVDQDAILFKRGSKIADSMMVHEIGHAVLARVSAGVNLPERISEIVAGYVEFEWRKQNG
ncbi:hypothetical protein CCP3SC15_150012 [Gammaproteobacteria bacterium]